MNKIKLVIAYLLIIEDVYYKNKKNARKILTFLADFLLDLIIGEA